MAIGHGLDQDARPEGHIAAGKHAGSRGHQVIVDLENSARRDLHALFATEEREVGLLADGQDHAVAGNDLFFVAECRIETAVFVEDRKAAANLEAGHDAILANNLLRSPAVVDHDAFVLGFVHFAFPCRHLRARFKADHVHLFRAGTQCHAGCIESRLQAFGIVFLGKIDGFMHQANSGARHIDGHVAAANNHYALAQFDLKSEIDVDEKIDAVVDARQVRAGNVQFAALVKAGGQQNRIELRSQIGEGDVAPHASRACAE